MSVNKLFNDDEDGRDTDIGEEDDEIGDKKPQPPSKSRARIPNVSTEVDMGGD